MKYTWKTNFFSKVLSFSDYKAKKMKWKNPIHYCINIFKKSFEVFNATYSTIQSWNSIIKKKH